MQRQCQGIAGQRDAAWQSTRKTLLPKMAAAVNQRNLNPVQSSLLACSALFSLNFGAQARYHPARGSDTPSERGHAAPSGAAGCRDRIRTWDARDFGRRDGPCTYSISVPTMPSMTFFQLHAAECLASLRSAFASRSQDSPSHFTATCCRERQRPSIHQPKMRAFASLYMQVMRQTSHEPPLESPLPQEPLCLSAPVICTCTRALRVQSPKSDMAAVSNSQTPNQHCWRCHQEFTRAMYS